MSEPAAAETGHEMSAPDWLDEMPAGHWYRISGNDPDLDLTVTERGTRYLEDGDPAMDIRLNPSRSLTHRLRRLAGRYVMAPWSGRCGFSAITEAWNGAVFADRFGRSGSMIVFGGGHNDYFGSDVHAFDLATRQWRRISDGYVSGETEAYGQGAVYPDAEYPDGSPLPPHTYEYVQYDPAGNDLLLLKGQLELGPNVTPTPVPHMFNLDSLTWRRGPKHPRAVLNSAGWTTWDAARRTLWGNSGNDGNTFIGFCPDGPNTDGPNAGSPDADGAFGSWGPLFAGNLAGNADHNAMMIDPGRDIIVVLAHGVDTLYVIDPAEPDKAAAPLASTGPRPPLSPYAAIGFARNLGAFVYFSAVGSPDVYAIEAPEGTNRSGLTGHSWRWRTLLADSNALDPVADAAAVSRYEVNRDHTFGRFRVASYGATDVAILVRHVDSPVYAMKLT